MLDMKILIGLHRNVIELDKKTAALAANFDITFSQFMVLEALYSKGTMTIGEVRDSILSSVGTISVIIKNLEKRGHIERLNDPQDRRICRLQLTESGNELISELAPQNEAMIRETFSVLEEEEKALLNEILRKVRGNLNGTPRENKSTRIQSD